MDKYNPNEIEPKWQKYWEEKGLHKAEDFSGKPKYYVLDMFPYPSGEGLHVGHPKGYIATDIYSRYKKMNGYNILHPMGWDAFGLPAENYAIKTGTHPKIITKKNTDTYRKQLKLIGFNYDWSREINTTDPEYYKWTQWIFLQMFKKGLAYESDEPINWCPSCKTGLANEDLDGNQCERCGTLVEKKPIRQWVLKITEYADRMLEDLDGLDWPESIKESQRNWIGKSEGAEIEFKVKSEKNNVIIVDGCGDDENDDVSGHWQPWLKQKLNNCGISVSEPKMPTPWNPKYSEWKKVFEENDINENTILVGFSCGASFLVRWLGETQIKIKKLILVAPCTIPSKEYSDGENELYDYNIDENIKNNVKDIIIFTSDNEGVNGKKSAEIFEKSLSGKVISLEDHGHFTQTDMGTSEFPELLEEIIQVQKEDVLILHGWGHSSKSGFIPELRKILKKKGHKVIALDLPNTDAPNFDEWLDFAEKSIEKNNLKNFSVVGHSMGGHLALKLAEKYKLKKLVLVAPVGFEKKTSDYFLQFKDELSADELNILKNYQDRDLDAESVIKNVDSINFFFGENDDWINSEIRNFYCRKFKNTADISVIPKEGHLSEDEGVKKVPEVENVFSDKKIEVFTTRVDTLFGATYCVLAPENSLVDELRGQIENWDEVEKYRREAAQKAEMERTAEGKGKTGVELKGIKAVNPANGEEIPIFVADYVLGHYGTGAVMAVPAHDERDYKFAKKFGLPLKIVVCPYYPKPICPVMDKAYTGKGKLVDSGEFTGMSSEKAREEIVRWLEKKGLGKKKTTYKLRDWVFSRQRYWGEPIPIIHCGKCALNDPAGQGAVPVPEKDLPVELPEVEHYEPTGTGESPLAGIEEWVNVKCPKCGGQGKRETNTMPQWAGSSWYYLRYIDPHNDQVFVDKEKEKYWSPVDMYVGGAEHATRHLIYARFWHKFLYDIKAVNYKEPFMRLHHVGLIQAKDGRKMSKRYGNVINPDDIVKDYGADTLRLYEMFMGPFDQAIPWSTESMVGLKRFLEKVWKLQHHLAVSPPSELGNSVPKLEGLVHRTIKKVTEDIEDFKFNTAISQMMILVNEMEKEKRVSATDYSVLTTLLSPFAPHIAEELWSRIGRKESIFKERWPKCDSEKIKEKKIKLVVQIDGKVRDIIETEAGISEEGARLLTLKRENVKKYLEDKSIRKIIFVSNKLINIVTDN